MAVRLSPQKMRGARITEKASNVSRGAKNGQAKHKVGMGEEKFRGSQGGRGGHLSARGGKGTYEKKKIGQTTQKNGIRYAQQLIWE